MQTAVKTTPLGRARDDAAVLFVRAKENAARFVRSCGSAFSGGYASLREGDAFDGSAEQTRVLLAGRDTRLPRLVLAGIGDGKDLEKVRSASASAARAARDAGAGSISLVMPAKLTGRAASQMAEALVEGAVVGLYRYETFKSKPSKQNVSSLTLLTNGSADAACRKGAEEGRILGEGVCLARDLGNEPGNTGTPTFLAETAKRVCDADASLSLKILEEDEMEALGMGSLLGVGKGSAEPSKLILMTYEPRRRGGKRAPTVAIVGKGITFDTGGISIKPAAKLEDMKFDMCGGAAVIGAMQTIAALKISTRVVGVVPAVENMPDGAAYKPGDILRAMNGTTIEVRNTDAEGRLILADALAYVSSKLRPKPKAVVDLATLTGACVVALGNHHAAVISNHEHVVEELRSASATSGDALWRMPLGEGHTRQLDSPYADVSNLGTPGAGTLTAAAFLQKFTGDRPWAHLDIAGMAWTDRNDGRFTKGATGFGVRVLARFLQSWKGS